ncbi:uncharacterized protein BJ171DRAFT_495825 [Polychytrium aggregatum]|uniref:uncharacterized protein n=1 Tax=Polychytrium aggregatum TaxID=110093 RepID=UPI0022FDB26C|nr:uncharacterized protein BJ171DRAFT_495825 [Polychytrium aggregatum]KAI9206561.1 hypothetical protein BJ171DRAFT_495825 [Polychytrium aggregatum]
MLQSSRSTMLLSMLQSSRSTMLLSMLQSSRSTMLLSMLQSSRSTMLLSRSISLASGSHPRSVALSFTVDPPMRTSSSSTKTRSLSTKANLKWRTLQLLLNPQSPRPPCRARIHPYP